MAVFPTIIITIALVFYSVGVWSERIQGRLKPWHLVFFILGLICDTWGTGLMFEYVGGMTFDIHGITGVIAIVLMFIHALWALIVLLRNDGGFTFVDITPAGLAEPGLRLVGSSREAPIARYTDAAIERLAGLMPDPANVSVVVPTARHDTRRHRFVGHSHVGLVLAALMFCIGAFGALARRNVIVFD